MGENKSFPDHFSAVASRYADFRPRYPSRLFDLLANLVPRDVLVWDCAAGNGQATVDLAARFDRVVATDASREQIASALPHPRIDYRVAPAEESGLPDGSVGLLTVAQALHWFDLDRFYAEARRVLRPGGVLAVWAYGVTAVDGKEVNDLVQEFYETTVGPYWPPQRTLVEDGYRSIPFPFAEVPTAPMQMEANWTLDQLIGYLGTWSATNRYIKATGLNPLEPLRESLATHWGDEKHPRRILWPLPLRIGKKSPDFS